MFFQQPSFAKLGWCRRAAAAHVITSKARLPSSYVLSTPTSMASRAVQVDWATTLANVDVCHGGHNVRQLQRSDHRVFGNELTLFQSLRGRSRQRAFAEPSYIFTFATPIPPFQAVHPNVESKGSTSRTNGADKFTMGNLTGTSGVCRHNQLQESKAK